PNVPDVILTVATAEYWTDADDPRLGPEDMGLDMDREEWATALRVLQQANLVKSFGGYRDANRQAGLAALHQWYPETRPEPVDVDDEDDLFREEPQVSTPAPPDSREVLKTPPPDSREVVASPQVDHGAPPDSREVSPIHRMQDWQTAVVLASPSKTALRVATAFAVVADSRSMTGWLTEETAAQRFGITTSALYKGRAELRSLGLLAEEAGRTRHGVKVWRLTSRLSGGRSA